MNRREVFFYALATGLFFKANAADFPRVPRPPSASKWSLWYREPADKWVESLPVGSGRLGAMVFGGVETERLQLNEDTFWAGGPYNPAHEDALEALPKVRDLIWREQYAEAQQLANEKLMARPLVQPPYQTLGSFELTTQLNGAVSEYRRWLDLEAAEAITAWRSGDRHYRRSVIASGEDQVILVRCSVDDGPIALSIRHDSSEIELSDDRFWVRQQNNSSQGVEGKLNASICVEIRGANTPPVFKDGKIYVEGQSEIALVVAAATNYVKYDDVSANADERAVGYLDAVADMSLATLAERHLRSHRRLFDTFDIDLGNDLEPDLATNERIRFSHDGWDGDNFLAALYVQYGRYLLISSSRPGSQPANLQGIWNNSNTPPWGSKYTININTEMNYWPAERLGLSECVEPFIRMMEDLAVSGRRTAETHYGARGWVAHHNTDLWRATAPVDGAFWGLWPTGGAWLCQTLWDHWDYGRDEETLRRIYPILRDCGVFFLDALVEHPDGYGLVTCPSVSPENAHHPGVSICAGPACDSQILRELFRNIIEASHLLDADADLRSEFESALARLPADRIGESGQLQEWLEDWDMEAPEIQHRHVSHLYAVYPGHEIGPETPELLRAAERSLSIRGDDATGWGIGWRINLWARLGNGGRAYNVLRKLLGPDRTYPNMFDAHPPFQIDGNFGGAAGVAEMLVRDRPQELHLLAALPTRSWPKGALRGLRVRGALTLDLEWDEGKVTLARFRAHKGVERNVRYGSVVKKLKMRAGERRDLRF